MAIAELVRGIRSTPRSACSRALLDAIGGVIGAIAGPRYLRWSRRTRERVEVFARDLARRERSTRASRHGALALMPA